MISSVNGLTGIGSEPYSSAKAGLHSLTQNLAVQLGPDGIRVNAIAPGFFKSEMTDQYKPDYLESLSTRFVLPRMGDPAELAATLVWLASPAAGYVTGQTIAVDGGVTIT
jgi:NAD(P)-dependent dehydrogenase (short-subunit alcohol dehydrogenase family)